MTYSTLFIGLISAAFFGLTVLFYALLRRFASAQQKTFEQWMQSSKESWLTQQQQSDLAQSTKQSLMRQELLAEFQNNRKELQFLMQSQQQTLNDRIFKIEEKLETRLKNLTDEVQNKLETNVKEGFKHFEKVQEALKLAETQLMGLNQVGTSVQQLNQLLKLPHLRGSFGEAQLERLLRDLLPAHSYEMQYQLSPSSKERVDAVIKLPNFVLPIDSKFPREQVLPLFESAKSEEIEKARKVLCDVMRTLAKQIKEKYIKPQFGTTEMALLFLPSETLYFEVIQNTELTEELRTHKVFPTSPHTLCVTLQSIAMAQNYYEMAKGIEKTIQNLQKTRQHLNLFEKKFQDVGEALGKATTSYQVSLTHLSRYQSSLDRMDPGEAEPLPPPGVNC